MGIRCTGSTLIMQQAGETEACLLHSVSKVTGKGLLRTARRLRLKKYGGSVAYFLPAFLQVSAHSYRVVSAEFESPVEDLRVSISSI